MMRIPALLPALRRVSLLGFLALSLLAGCGTLRSFLPRREPDPHSVTISWTASTAPVAGYYVYRVSEFSGPVRLTNCLVTATQYTDHTVGVGETYSFYVTAVDSTGTEGKPSENISVTVPAKLVPPPTQ